MKYRRSTHCGIITNIINASKWSIGKETKLTAQIIHTNITVSENDRLPFDIF